MTVLQTERLALHRLQHSDAVFVLELLNDPEWLEYIGDKGVRTPADARRYIGAGPLYMYEKLGFGLYLVERRSDRNPIGVCGLIKRDALPDVDLGVAFLPSFRGNGYAYESARATMSYARAEFGLRRIAAIISPRNLASIRLIGKLGFVFEQMMKLDEQGIELGLYAAQL